MDSSQNINDLIEAINGITLNHKELMEIVLDYSSVYFRNKILEEQEFDEFLDHPVFIEQAVIAARDGIVLGMQAIVLNTDFSFKEIVNSCINLKNQRDNEKKITRTNEKIKVIREFFTFLRKELFSRIFSQNKDLQKISKINKEILQKRYDFFMTQTF